MPAFTLRWANRSAASSQDWMINNGDNFTLAPNFVRAVNININADHTYVIAVTIDGGNTAAHLTYTAATNTWAINSVTPNVWGLSQGNGIVTVRCLL